MPPKNSKVKIETVPPDKVYELITWEEIQNKEHKYQNHIMNLRKCLKYIEDSSTVEAELEAQQLVNNKWLEYLSCCPLPKPYVPPDIRLSITKLKYFENESILTTLNRLLSVDECSFLTQNIFAPNLTRKALSSQIKPNFCYEYNANIEFCLEVLKRIDYLLLNRKQVTKCSSEILKDIKQLHYDIQQEINGFFNRFTYRILCSEEAYLNFINAFTADYNFQGDNFQIHIWSLKNVPMRFNQLDESSLIANLDGVNIILQIPLHELQQNFTIRAIRMNFDHISENAKSFFIPKIVESVENSNACIENLPKCLMNEWQMQLNIQKRIRNEMLEKRHEYEEKLRLFQEQEEKMKSQRTNIQKGKKGSQKVSKKKKLLKPHKEPPYLAENMYPDIWDDFLKEEQKQYEEFINTTYNPKSMGLNSDEINLKKYFILGGIYQLYKVQKPLHYDFKSFNMTWHENNSNLIIDPHVVIKPSSKFIQRRSSLTIKRLTERSLLTKIQEVEPLTDSQCPWFVVIITLPEYLCNWGQPLVCQYETITKSTEGDNSSSTNVTQEPSKTLLVTSPKIPNMTKKPDIKDLTLLQPEKGSLSQSILNIQYPSQENYSRTSLSNLPPAKYESIMKVATRDSKGVININDFSLNTFLNSQQTKDIQSHIMSRMISSFKFPKEIREDEIRVENQNNPKTKGGILIRKRPDNVTDQNTKHAKGFYFGPKQDNPERVIAIFPPEYPLHIINPIREIFCEEPKTFAQLLETINVIKWQYKMRVRKIMDLKPFKSKFFSFNKRVEGVRRQKLKNPTPASSLSHVELPESHSKVYSDRESQKKSIESKVELLNASTSENTVLENKKVAPTYSYNCWTTQHIMKSEYNREKRIVMIQTDRLGYFGLAFKRYEHFPFKFWKLEPNINDPENEIIFTLDTQHVRCVLKISEKGIRGYVTEPTTKFMRNPKMYLVIDEPISDCIKLKKIFREKYLNIFADNDACYYVENGYFSEKHLSTELHTYNCISINSTQIKFIFSHWNRLAQRRDIILKFLQYQDSEENMVEVRITPEESFFVEITELCSDNVDVINLQYNLTWRNITSCGDLHHLINSMYLTAKELRCKNDKIINFLRTLLCEIRPLSFS